MNRFYSVFAFVAIALIGCSVAGAVIPTREPPTAASDSLETPEATELPREVITLTISLFLLVDDNEEHDPQISTHRTEAELREILQGMMAGALRPFFREVGGGITIPQTSTINGFYLRRVGGPNGINPFRSRTYFVIDEPSVFDRRVSSHEVGHMLGLHHVLGDAGRLLFSGTNGMTLTEDEATVARYFARGILQGLR